MESRKNLKPTGFGLRMERIKPPLVVENPENYKLDRVSVMEFKHTDYSQVSLRQTLSREALSVYLRESSQGKMKAVTLGMR